MATKHPSGRRYRLTYRLANGVLMRTDHDGTKEGKGKGKEVGKLVCAVEDVFDVLHHMYTNELAVGVGSAKLYKYARTKYDTSIISFQGKG